MSDCHLFNMNVLPKDAVISGTLTETEEKTLWKREGVGGGYIK